MSEKNIPGFEALIEPMIMDGYLDNGEEVECMMKASQFGLTGPEAQDILEEKCDQHGAKLERVQKKKFRREIEAMVDDKFLDESEEEELLSLGVQFFEGADSPRDLTSDVLEEVLLKERAYTARKVTADIERALQPYINAGQRKIPEADWQAIKQKEVKLLEGKNVDLEDNEIPVLLDSVLRGNGMSVGDDGAGNKKLLLGGVVAAVVLLIALFGFLANSGSDSTTGTTGKPIPPEVSSADCPAMDDELAARIKGLNKDWREAVDDKRYTTPTHKSASRYGRELKSACSPFEDGLPPSQQSECKASQAGWAWCELDSKRVAVMESNYLRWGNDRNNPVSCQTWMKRCLELASGSEPCNARMRHESCR
jgi:hypothetical protein